MSKRCNGTDDKATAPEKLGKVKRFFNEFKTFAITGNMMDMAVGLIVGGAFTAFVDAIVKNIAMPFFGMLIGVDFSDWEIELPHLYGDGDPNIISIGLFLNSLISFIVVAFVVFLFVKAINRFRSKKEALEESEEKKISDEVKLLSEIRDLLKQNAPKDSQY